MTLFTDAYDAWTAQPDQVEATAAQTLLLQLFEELVETAPEELDDLRPPCQDIWTVLGEGFRVLD